MGMAPDANEAPGETPGAVDGVISRRVSQWLQAEPGRSQTALSAETGIPTTSLSHYVRGTRRWPASAVYAISQALNVTICELYGVNEIDRGVPVTIALTDQVRRLASIVDPDRIEVAVYVRGEFGSGKSHATLAARFQPKPADWDLKQLLERWPSLTDRERQGWLEFAEAITTHDNTEL